jgi:hypothetical protein
VKDFKRKYGAKFVPIPGDARKRHRLEPRLIWQQDGATAHWSAREMRLLEELGFTKEEGTILVETIKQKWPARSPDMNWLDQFVWGVMAIELRYVSVRSRQGLIRAIKKIWREKITPEFCKKCIDHFFKQGDRACPWWNWGGTDPVTGAKTKNPCTCGGHGTLDDIIKRKGDRVTFAKTSDGASEE